MDTMNPSNEPATDGQIGRVTDLLGAKIRKHKNEFSNEIVQKVIEQQGGPMSEELFAVFRKYVEANSNMILLAVKVNRNRSAQEAINATGRKKYLTDSVVANMPHGEGEETEVVFFKLGRDVSVKNLEKEYELRGLKPDPIAQAAVNEADPAFADEHPNGSQWKDADGKYCFAAFDRWDDGERSVGVDRYDRGWFGDWWFAGVRK